MATHGDVSTRQFAAIPECRSEIGKRQQRGRKRRVVPRDDANAPALGGSAHLVHLRQQRTRQLQNVGIVSAQPLGEAGAREVGKNGKRQRDSFVGRHGASL
jgi:hypothetical protein